MRFSASELHGMLARSPHVKVNDAFGGSVPGKRRDGKGAKRPVDASESVDRSVISGSMLAGKCFSAYWDGAHLLSLNELLRFDHRTGALKRYRSTCHEAASRAVYQVSEGRPFTFREKVNIVLYRRAHQYLDADAVAAAFKFIIDGFRKAKLIPNDNPRYLGRIEIVQELGDPMIGCRFSLAGDGEKS